MASTYRKRKRSRLFHSIDVLTDGSEGTGEGTVFFSVWKSKDHESNPLARYTLNGLGDLSSRLAADQRFKLGSVRAVFCSSLTTLWGIPALQLELRRAGAEKLSIVASNCDKVETLMQLCSRKGTYPMVSLCQIPVSKDSSNWWHVYRDDYVTVFASSLKETAVFLLVLNEENSGLLILPPGIDSLPDTIGNCLPTVDENAVSIRWTLSLGAIDKDTSMEGAFYTTNPNQNDHDSRLLTRARDQAMAWYEVMPEYFSWLPGATSVAPKATNQLVTGDSVWLESSDIVSRVKSSKTSLERKEWPKSILSFLEFQRPADVEEEDDQNEIQLSDSDSNEDCQKSTTTALTTGSKSRLPKLHILGTGSAAPSAYRGASGYVIRWTDHNCKGDLSIVVEAGEGICTQWYRHVASSLSCIRIIWVSHAHWDHCGGLAPLLRSIHVEKPVSAEFSNVPVVMAPRKVLSYLDSFFECSANIFKGVGLESHNQVSDIFHGIRLHDGYHPVAFWENIRVEHSCLAFGFLCGLNQDRKLPYVFCFSGDTVPSNNLIQTCRRAVKEVDFLLHEATFGDDQLEMSARKKHTTVGQAARVMSSIRARRLLLTHFSQRYDNPCTIESNKNAKIGYAFDGMSIQF